jgi:putative CocE/NonD family hydrolase
MSKILNVRMIATLALAVVFALALGAFFQNRSGEVKVSEFGKYQGYSEASYDGTHRSSDYLTLSDGTRLAYDLIIPTQKGVIADKPLPVLFKYTPYGRTWTIFDKNGNFILADMGLDLPTQVMARARYLLSGEPGRFMDPLWRDRWLGDVVKHGYIVVSVDIAGTGASFSSPRPSGMETAAVFTNEILNWIAAQPWSDGNIGMYGDSHQAMVQFAAASMGNPHLKAILPAASQIEIYNATEYPGGVFNQAFFSMYSKEVPFLDRLITPVDGDPEGVLLAQALEQRQNKVGLKDATQIAMQSPFVDSIASDGIAHIASMDLYPFVDRINHSHTAVYLTVGWYDVFTADMFYWYNNLSVPKRLTVRPTDHTQVSANLADLNYGTEALRWLDYWLKGIDNGIMHEPPIHYYVQDGPNKGTWQTSDQWPLASQKSTNYYFGTGKTGSVASVNDGSLVTDSPAEASAVDAYTVDYSTTTGDKTRWSAVEEPHAYPDLRANDAKALTYTTPPLETDVEVTGHPVVQLWLTTAAPDLDAFVYLEEVDSQGKSTYITEGDLRASHRKLSRAPFNIFGLPYHSHLQADQQAIPSGQPFELTFSLLPTSYQFHAGSRIRTTVAFADAGNFGTPILSPAPTLTLLRDMNHPSLIRLPVVH